jgi:hypothetical protein
MNKDKKNCLKKKIKVIMTFKKKEITSRDIIKEKKDSFQRSELTSVWMQIILIIKKQKWDVYN